MTQECLDCEETGHKIKQCANKAGKSTRPWIYHRSKDKRTKVKIGTTQDKINLVGHKIKGEMQVRK